MQQQHLYEFGSFTVDTKERVLLREGRLVPLKPKVYETLLVLVRNSGHVVEKEELMNQVWPDTFVEENNLTGNIFALRRAFGEHQYIETVPRRGYRFTAEVKKVRIEDIKVLDLSGTETDVVIKETVGIGGQAIRSLAVLPFINGGADPDAEYLSDGLTESIISNLSQLSQLRVMGRSTVFRYKGRESDPRDVGRELKVRGVLVGRIVKLHNLLSVRAELIDVLDGAQLWGNQYSRNVSDIFAIQEEISSAISAELRLKLTGEERDRLRKHYTESTKAFHSYLRGRYHLNKRTPAGLQKAVDHFGEAIEFDPAYALAYAGLADSYTLLGSAAYDAPNPQEIMAKAKAAALKALEIDDTLAEAYVSLAFVKFRLDWDWPAAEIAFKRAIGLKPSSATAHHWYGLFLSAMGRHYESISEIEQAKTLDPLSLIITSAAGRVYHFARQYDRAVEEYGKTTAMDASYAEAHFNLGLTNAQKGMYPEAIAELREAIKLCGTRPVMLAVLGYVYAAAGDQRQAHSLLEQLEGLSDEHYVSPVDKAIIYTGLEEKEQACECLEQAYQERCGPLVYLKVEPLYDGLRSEPRFNNLLSRMNLGAQIITEGMGASIPQEMPGERRPAPYAVAAPQKVARRASMAAIAIVFTVLAIVAGVYIYRRGSSGVGRFTEGQPIKSIAVLPFKPLGGEADDEFLSLGMADAVITKLSGFKQVVVRPTSSILRYARPANDALEAGHEQMVDAVLEGKFQMADERIRVTVQLLRTSDGSSLWADKFDEKLTDIFSLQDAISERVARALIPELTDEEEERLARRYTEIPEAYQLYIKGRYFWNKRTEESLHKGIDYFRQAIERDPSYALAYAGLADSYIILGNFGLLSPKEAYPKARGAAQKALEIDGNLAEAQVSMAFVKALFDWDWPGADAGFKRAIELNPNYGPAHQWYGVYLAGAGRSSEAVAQAQRAQEVDPLSLTINAVVGWMLYFDHQYDRVIEQEYKTLEMDPNFALPYRYRGMAYEQKGMYKEAIADFKKAVTLSGTRPNVLGALGHAYALAGQRSEALKVLADVMELRHRTYFPSYEIALIYTGTGAKDQAFQWLEKAYEERSPWLIHLKVDPRFDSLRSDPRFAALTRKVGVPS